MKSFSSITLLAASCLFNAMAGPAAPATSIIPAPAKAETREGQFKLTVASRIIADDALKETAELLAERLRPAPGFPLRIKSANTTPSAGDIVLTTNGADTSLGPEGYKLSIRPTSVTIRALTKAGIFYGEQSLLQLLPADVFSSKPVYDAAWAAPCVEISDSPRFPWRGMLLDVGRHFFTKAEVEQVLNLMALY